MNNKEMFEANLYGEIFREVPLRSPEVEAEIVINFSGLRKEFFMDKNVLDAGCGYGRAVLGMLKMGAKVSAIDISPANIRFVKENIHNLNLDIKQGSILNLPYEDNQFDIVHCMGVIQSTSSPDKALSEITRVLKPGGTMVLGVLGKGGIAQVIIYVSRAISKVIPYNIMKVILLNRVISKIITKRGAVKLLDVMYVPYQDRYNEKETCELFSSAGFNKLKRVKWKYDHTKLRNKIIYGSGFVILCGVKEFKA